MAYEWTFTALALDDPNYPNYATLGTSTEPEPEFYFGHDAYDYRWATVTLKVTDSVNGMEDTIEHGFTIDRSGTPPGGGGGTGDVVTIEATDPSAAENGDTGMWTLQRTKTVGPLTVTVATSGTAKPGADYKPTAPTATFEAGQDTVDIMLVPVKDVWVEPAEVATMTVKPGNGYTVGDPDSADITIRADAAGRCGGRRATIMAMFGKTVIGTSGNDVIIGTAGNDVIKAKGGNDLICAGRGNDTVNGGAGNDKIWGQGGNDTLKGGPGHDKIWGQGGNDRIWGQGGHDTLKGGPGHDKIWGQGGKDKLWGQGGADILRGGTGGDLLVGGVGRDVCQGGPGQDTLRSC